MFLQQMKQFIEWLQNAEEGEFEPHVLFIRSAVFEILSLFIFRFIAESGTDEDE